MALKRTIAFILALVILLSGCSAATVAPATLPPETTVEPTTKPTVAPTLQETTVPEPTEEAIVPETAPPTEAETVPSEPEFDPIAFANQLSTEEKVGQLFLARCPELNAVEDIQTYHLGGYILFDRDFRHRTPDEVRSTLAEYRQAASIPLLIAVDEEGGSVTRVSCYSQYRDTTFPAPRDLYAQGGIVLVEETEREKCSLLRSLGINVNMAPVCDVTTDPEAFMYDRALGQPPYTTAYFTKTLVKIMEEHRVGSVLKHFPGYGNNSDTHTGIAVDDRTLAELSAMDLIPFSAGINAGCDAILVSHTIVNALDENAPASLSAEVHSYLRQDMGFDGVIVTDDLVMQAITDLYGAEEAAVLAVLAGNDLLCSSEYQVQYAAVLDAVRTGRISAERLDQAVARILQWKHRLGLITE